MARRTKAQARKTGRRWHIPPPLVHGAQPLEGGELLAEGSGPEAVLLWQALRDVVLWAGTPPEERALLFRAEGHGAAARLSLKVEVEEPHPQTQTPNSTSSADPLRVLLRLPLESATVQPVAIASACRALSERLEAEGRGAGALGFAQAAALAMPGDAQAAFRVGRIARGRADHARAEVWYRRAIGLARQSRDWRLYAQSFRSLGQLYALRGNYPGARRLQIRALRGARRGGMRLEMGHALHELFTIALETGADAEAEEFARQALEAYRPRGERLPQLAHDLAYFWMERGQFGRALPVFHALAGVLPAPRERLFATANLARAAAGAGDLATWEASWTEAWSMLEAAAAPGDGAARALVDLARGAQTLRQWERAEQAAERALHLAAERDEGKVLFAAEALLDWARRRVAAPAVAATDAATADPASGEGLEGRVVAALQALSAPG